MPVLPGTANVFQFRIFSFARSILFPLRDDNGPSCLVLLFLSHRENLLAFSQKNFGKFHFRQLGKQEKVSFTRIRKESKCLIPLLVFLGPGASQGCSGLGGSRFRPDERRPWRASRSSKRVPRGGGWSFRWIWQGHTRQRMRVGGNPGWNWDFPIFVLKGANSKSGFKPPFPASSHLYGWGEWDRFFQIRV